MPNRERLPKWAQEELEGLEHKLERERAKLAERTVTNTVVDPGSIDGDGSYLHDRSRVRFYFVPGEHGPSDPWIDIRREGRQLIVIGSDTLHVHPWVTNIIHVDVTDRLEDFRK